MQPTVYCSIRILTDKERRLHVAHSEIQIETDEQRISLTITHSRYEDINY